METITVSGLLIFYCFRPNRSIKLMRCSSGTFLVTFSAYWSLSQVPSVINWGFGINQSWGSWRESEEGVLSSSHGCGTLINGWLADCCCSKGGVYLLCGVACSFAFQGGHWDWKGSFNVFFFLVFVTVWQVICSVMTRSFVVLSKTCPALRARIVLSVWCWIHLPPLLFIPHFKSCLKTRVWPSK